MLQRYFALCHRCEFEICHKIENILKSYWKLFYLIAICQGTTSPTCKWVQELQDLLHYLKPLTKRYNIICLFNVQVFWFLVAAVTYYHRLGCFETMEIYFLTILEANILQSMSLAKIKLLAGSRSALACSSFRWLPTFLGWWPYPSSLCPSSSRSCLLCVC